MINHCMHEKNIIKRVVPLEILTLLMFPLSFNQQTHTVKDNLLVFHVQMILKIALLTITYYLSTSTIKNTVPNSFQKCFPGNVTASGICSRGLLLKAKMAENSCSDFQLKLGHLMKDKLCIQVSSRSNTLALPLVILLNQPPG